MANNLYQDQAAFNSAAYLAANPDVASAIGKPGVGSAWEHYQNFGQKEGRQAVFGESTVTDPSQWEAMPTNLNPYTGEYENTFFKDPATGNLYSSNEANANLIAQGQAINDPYAQSLGLNPEEANTLYNLKATDPNQYYEQIANKLGDAIYKNYGSNQNYDALYNQLQGIKEVDPKAYYQNQLEFLGQQIGWQVGQNRNDRTSPVYDQINALIPEAQAAGLSADKINSLVGTSINEANAANQQRIINEQQSGNFWKDNLIGTLKVGALAAGAYGLDTALNAGATGVNGALQSYLGTTGGAFVPAEGFSATLPGFANAAGSGSYLASELAGPTYGELGITGVEGGFAGPTYAEMGYTGLNQGQAIAAADAASKGLTLSEALNYANKARTGLGLASSIAKAVGGGNSGVKSGTNGIDLSKLASALAGSSFTPMNVAQIQSRNPFIFDVPGQTQASEGMYDVSGSNLAKALRKA